MCVYSLLHLRSRSMEGQKDAGRMADAGRRLSATCEWDGSEPGMGLVYTRRADISPERVTPRR